MLLSSSSSDSISDLEITITKFMQFSTFVAVVLLLQINGDSKSFCTQSPNGLCYGSSKQVFIHNPSWLSSSQALS